MIWINKYKPKELGEYYHENYIKIFIKNILNGDFPHLIFYGTSGSGKTSAALLISKQYIKKNNLIDSLLIINASDEKGIKTIRDNIKSFISYKSNNIKIVIIDEADALSDESQLALRRIIEINSKQVRFILICNYINKLVYSLLSRFIKVKFKRLSKENINSICSNIIKQENIIVSEECLEYLYSSCNNDIRKIIINLQKFQYTNKINFFFENDKNIFKVTNFKEAHILTNKLIADGYNSNNVIEYVSCKINNLAKEDYLLYSCSNSYLQIMKILAKVIEYNKNNVNT